MDIHCGGERDGTAHVEDGVQRVETGGDIEEGLFVHGWPEYRWEEVAGGDEGPDSDEHRVVDLGWVAFATRNLVPVRVCEDVSDKADNDDCEDDLRTAHDASNGLGYHCSRRAVA